MGMTKTGFTIAGAGIILASAVLTASHQQKTTKDGVFTKAQTERVTEMFGKVCANCHDPAKAKVAEGKKPAPPLSGDLFLDNWKDKTLGELMATIRLTMPNDGSMTLTADDAADLTALILLNNKFPEGKDPLKYDDASKKIVFAK